MFHHKLHLAALAACECLACRAAPVSLPPGRYDVTTQTVLPHLEENLRDASARTQRCLATQDAATVFPILLHEAFAGCSLDADASTAPGNRYLLRCANPQAASGAASFEPGAITFRAQLDIKMGGKNMTLLQRVHGRRIGSCETPEAAASEAVR